MSAASFLRVSAIVLCLVAAGDLGAAERLVFRCPMHPDVRGATRGECTRCRMPLVPVPETPGAYPVRVQLEGASGTAEQPSRLRFQVEDPTDRPVTRFVEVHERPFHAFVISQDLAFFAHLHPSAAGGTLAAEVMLPGEGIYHIVSDFLPDGGAPQLVQRAVATRGFTGDPAAVKTRLPALVPQAATGTTRVSLRLPPGAGLVAGEPQAFRLTLHDTEHDRPVTDLEPFLGAPAHLFAASEDLVDVAHSHPVMAFSTVAGPDVVFEVVFPRPGRYRLWAQYQRHGTPGTVFFDVPVGAAP